MLDDTSSSPALDRGLTILEMVAKSNSGCGFLEIRDKLSLSPASANRLLKALTAREYLQKDEISGKYVFGPAIANLSEGHSIKDRLKKSCRKHLPVLRDACENTALFIYWDGAVLQCLAKFMHELSLAMQPEGEVRHDIFDYPWGAFVYRQLSNEDRQSEFGKRIGHWELKFIKNQLAEFDRYGFIFQEDKARRFTAPVCTGSGDFVGAVAVGGTRDTIEKDRYSFIAEKVIQTAELISREISDLQY